MKYTVEFIARLELEVEAENEIEAEDIANDILNMRDFEIIDSNVNEIKDEETNEEPRPNYWGEY